MEGSLLEPRIHPNQSLELSEVIWPLLLEGMFVATNFAYNLVSMLFLIYSFLNTNDIFGRNIIHGSDGPETAKDEINLWFKPEELTNYTSNQEKWVYGVN